MGLFALFLVGLLCGSVHSATITLSALNSPVTEGSDLMVQCSIPGAEPRDVRVDLEVDTSSTAENGFDADFVENYRCVIDEGDTTGTVNIPTYADTVTDNSDTLVITGTPENAGLDSVTGTASFAITDDGLGTAPTIRIREDFYVGDEGDGSIILIVELVDANGDVVPIEDADTVGFTFLTDDTVTATGGVDYDNTATDTLAGSAMGEATIQTMISLPLIDDSLPENVETLLFFLDSSVSTLSVDTTQITAFITDNDKPQIYALSAYATLPRRSRKIATLYAFTENTNNDIVWDSGPNMLSDSNVNDIGVAEVNGIELNLARPSRSTRSRFNWYTFSTTETTPAGNFDLFTASTISATGRRRLAPFNAIKSSTVTVCPASTNDGETDLGNPQTISVVGGVNNRRLRWSVYRNPGVSSERRLPLQNGKTSLEISKTDDIGLYLIFLRNRGRRGWAQYITVLPSECPCGTYHDAGGCDGGPLECQHGGFVDPSFNQGLCTCPPGYVGRLCEIPTDPGQFGNNGQFTVDQFFPGNNLGRGITFSFNYPFGSTCAAGFHGPGCMERCPWGTFGKDCELDCNCVDDVCEVNGVCPNGCAAGWEGYTCQTPTM